MLYCYTHICAHNFVSVRAKRCLLVNVSIAHRVMSQKVLIKGSTMPELGLQGYHLERCAADDSWFNLRHNHTQQWSYVLHKRCKVQKARGRIIVTESYVFIYTCKCNLRTMYSCTLIHSFTDSSLIRHSFFVLLNSSDLKNMVGIHSYLHPSVQLLASLVRFLA